MVENFVWHPGILSKCDAIKSNNDRIQYFKTNFHVADRLLEEGIYAIGFFYPVVAKGQARIRTQISAAHSKEDLDKAAAAFIKIGKELDVIS